MATQVSSNAMAAHVSREEGWTRTPRVEASLGALNGRGTSQLSTTDMLQGFDFLTGGFRRKKHQYKRIEMAVDTNRCWQLYSPPYKKACGATSTSLPLSNTSTTLLRFSRKDSARRPKCLLLRRRTILRRPGRRSAIFETMYLRCLGHKSTPNRAKLFSCCCSSSKANPRRASVFQYTVFRCTRFSARLTSHVLA